MFSTKNEAAARTAGRFGRPNCGRLTQVVPLLLLLCLIVLLPVDLPAQETDYVVYTDTPRLFLNQRRLRLLKRERERESLRWAQFESLMSGNARMAEPGFANALYGIVTGRAAYCEKAGEWAAAANMQDSAQSRQAALVYDWCLDALGESQSMALARKLSPLLRERPTAAAQVRSAALAAIALADVESKPSQEFLKWAVETWWRGAVIPKLKTGDQPFPRRADLLAMVEFLHVIRDNLRIDLREGAERWFEDLPPLLLLSYYPQPWPSAENEFRIPAYDGSGEPNLQEAALGRATELALVAFDTNAQPHSFLQGWLMIDRFLMRGSFGLPYEFLWANPYLPGLSYTYMPDLFHSSGRLMLRSSWDDDATWFSYDRGKAQAFQNGRRIAVNTQANIAPVQLGAVKVFFGQQGLRFETGWAPPPDPESRKEAIEFAFVVGLEPNTVYDVEVDDEEMFDERTDSGGILSLKFHQGRKAGVRIRKFTPRTQ